jgi:hypothetical protein
MRARNRKLKCLQRKELGRMQCESRLNSCSLGVESLWLCGTGVWVVGLAQNLASFDFWKVFGLSALFAQDLELDWEDVALLRAVHLHLSTRLLLRRRGRDPVGR